MGSIFNPDSSLMRGLGRLFDYVVLNMLTILCSIPIVTLGASVTAMYDVMGRMMRDEERGVFGDFFRAFRSNFKKATVIWLILLVIGALLGFGVYFYVQVEVTGGSVLQGIAVMLLLLWAMTLSWAFPLQAKFENTVRNTLQNAMIFAIAKLPRSIVMAVLNALPWFLAVWWTYLFLRISIFWVMIGFSLTAWINLKLLAKPYRQLIGEEDVPAEAAEE